MGNPGFSDVDGLPLGSAATPAPGLGAAAPGAVRHLGGQLAAARRAALGAGSKGRAGRCWKRWKLVH